MPQIALRGPRIWEASHTLLSTSSNVLVLRSTSSVVIASLEGPGIVADVEAPIIGSRGGVVSLAFRFLSLLGWLMTEWWK
jgi:hypothetical protein